MDPIQVRTYRDATAEAAARRFQLDAAEAAKKGYHPTSQVWEGTSLTVTYQRREPDAMAAPAPQTVAASRPVFIPSVAIAIGGILVAVGSLLPWLRVGLVSVGGMEGDGILTMIVGVGLILVGVAGMTDAVRASSLGLVAALASLVGLAIAGLHIVDIGGGGGPQTQTGEGLYAIAIGSLVALAGAIKSHSERFDIRSLAPGIRGDLQALPLVFRKPLVWLPFGLLLSAFVIELARQGGALPEGPVSDLGTLYVQLTLPPTSLFIFLIGGFVADRSGYLVGGILGAFDAALITILVLIAPEVALEGSGMSEVAEGLLPLWGIAIVVGVLAAGFAGWIRTSIRKRRSSRES
jgi:hypothetical protein